MNTGKKNIKYSFYFYDVFLCSAKINNKVLFILVNKVISHSILKPIFIHILKLYGVWEGLRNDQLFFFLSLDQLIFTILPEQKFLHLKESFIF